MIIDVTTKLVIEREAREWCRLPYPGHRNGCPNFGKRFECPPRAPMVDEYFDLRKTHWFLYVRFDLGSHIEKMKARHPEWSRRQCACCLYWQGTVRKELRKDVAFWQGELSKRGYASSSTMIPEAMGVNVFKTMFKFGHVLERNPTKYVYKIAMVGQPKEGGR